jgi:putative membrane protein
MLVRPVRSFPGAAFMFRGSALADIWPWLLVVFVISGGLIGLDSQFDISWLRLTLVPFSLVGLALSIFLGFRNNACYDRWWEARKLWGLLINHSRSFTRQALTLLSSAESADLKRELVRRHIAYVHALRLHLRRQDHWDELEPFLDADELEALGPERNKPIALLQRQAERLREAMDKGWIDRFHLPVLEGTLTTLTDIQGGCERIKNTPVPMSYTQLTHRIVGLYIGALPFGIVHDVGIMTPVVVVIVAYCFLGLDAVGTQIEDPFEEDPNDLPLAQISRMIENDLRQRIGDTDLRPELTPIRGVLL